MKAFWILLTAALLLALIPLRSEAAPEDQLERASKAYFQGHYRRAVSLAEKAIGTQKLSAKNFAVAYFVRGLAWRRLKQYRRALEDLTRVIDIVPQQAKGYNSLAWLLSTCPEDEYRDGPRAVVLAKKAVSLQESSGHLDTLAAALAEAGQFDKAVETQKLALAKLKSEGRESRKTSFMKRLEQYRARKPWRD